MGNRPRSVNSGARLAVHAHRSDACYGSRADLAADLISVRSTLVSRRRQSPRGRQLRSQKRNCPTLGPLRHWQPTLHRAKNPHHYVYSSVPVPAQVCGCERTRKPAKLSLRKSVQDPAGVRSDECPSLNALLSGSSAFFVAVGLSDRVLLAMHDGETAGFGRDWRQHHARESKQNRPGANLHCASPHVRFTSQTLAPRQARSAKPAR
jgi:hypothetical protein